MSGIRNLALAQVQAKKDGGRNDMDQYEKAFKNDPSIMDRYPVKAKKK